MWITITFSTSKCLLVWYHYNAATLTAVQSGSLKQAVSICSNLNATQKMKGSLNSDIKSSWMKYSGWKSLLTHCVICFGFNGNPNFNPSKKILGRTEQASWQQPVKGEFFLPIIAKCSLKGDHLIVEVFSVFMWGLSLTRYLVLDGWTDGRVDEWWSHT